MVKKKYTGIVIGLIGTNRLEVRYTGDAFGWCTIDSSSVISVNGDESE